MTTENLINAYGQVFDNLRQVTESGLKMQQDAMQQWTALWPGLPTAGIPSAQTIWIEKVRDFQQQWSNAVSDLAREHRTTLDRQYQSALASLEEALRASESTNPMEFRTRTELFFRKTLECMREACEVQLKEYQNTVNKMGETVGKLGS